MQDTGSLVLMILSWVDMKMKRKSKTKDFHMLMTASSSFHCSRR